MHMLFSLFSIACSVALAAPFGTARNQTRGIYWLLAGDSTTAPDGGWGPGFLDTAVAAGSSGHNYGHSGATTVSFREGGDWNRLLKDIGSQKSSYDVYVTIQFGHNDQKQTANISLPTFENNLLKFAQETSQKGGTPIILTPLTRRNFAPGATNITENLKDQTAAAIKVAETYDIKYIDLNRASKDYVNAIGKDNAAKYNYQEGDWTHLNPHGSVVFARIVGDLLVEKYGKEVGHSIKPNATLSALIKVGKPA